MSVISLKYFADRKSRMFFEMFFVLGLLGILASSAISGQQRAVRMASTANSLGVITTLKTQIHYHYEMFGRWPDSKDLQEKIDSLIKESREIETIAIEKGNVIITYNARYPYLDGYRLMFRKAGFPDIPGTPTIWLCGNQGVPEGMQTDAENVTDLPDDLLMRICKE